MNCRRLASPVLWRGVYGMTLGECLVVAYSGLRGAIGLAIALIVNETDGLESKLKMRILFHMSGIVVLTLCINGVTTRHVVHLLGMDRRSDAENEIFSHVTVDIDKKLSKEMAMLKREQYLGDADWRMVWRYVPVLSLDSYWLRIRDGKLHLSDAESADLGELSAQQLELANARLAIQRDYAAHHNEAYVRTQMLKLKHYFKHKAKRSFSVSFWAHGKERKQACALIFFFFLFFRSGRGQYPVPSRLQPRWARHQRLTVFDLSNSLMLGVLRVVETGVWARV